MQRPESPEKLVNQNKKGKWYAYIPNTGIKSFKFDTKEKAMDIAKYWWDNWIFNNK